MQNDVIIQIFIFPSICRTNYRYFKQVSYFIRAQNNRGEGNLHLILLPAPSTHEVVS